jgi:hypothetical protein
MENDKLYKSIGELVIKFQELELLVNFLLLELMNQDFDTGLCLTSEMSFSRIVTALVAVAAVRLKDPALVEEVRTCAGYLNQCEGERNKIVHSLYFSYNGALSRAKITAKRREGLRKMFYETSHDEIEREVERIKEANKHLMKVVKKLQAHGTVSNRFFAGAAKPCQSPP